MAGYIRADVDNDIENGELVDADVLDAEFNAIQAGFNASSGHKHDGSTGEGAPITVLGPVADFVASSSAFRPKLTSVYDLGTTALPFRAGYIETVLADDTVSSASAPHYSWNGDTNTGMYRSAADTIKFATGGQERVGIASDGTLSTTGNVTIAGTLAVTGAITANLTGNVTGSAATLTTARTIAIGTGATGTATSFNGSANITIPITAVDSTYLTGTIASARLSGSYTGITGTGALTAGSIGSGFGNIDIGSNTFTGNGAAITAIPTAYASGYSLGGVGTYAFLRLTSGTFTAGDLISGSNLRYTSIQSDGQGAYEINTVGGGTPSGNWRALGTSTESTCATLFLRVT
jgi:hypothetical protein